jgi:hypothetical protein
MSSRISWSGTLVLPVDPPVPQPVELLQPAFALRPPLRYWPARTEFPGEMSEQDLLFRFGHPVYGGFDFGERSCAESSTPRSAPASQSPGRSGRKGLGEGRVEWGIGT